MEFTSLFLEDFLLSSSSISTVPHSVIPTVAWGTGMATASVGLKVASETIDETDDTFLATTIGGGTSSIGSSFVTNAVESYNTTVEQLQTTQTYMESLNQEELEILITKLEEKNIELSIEDSNSKVKKL